MIRYPISPEELHARIEAEAPGWLKNAARRTKKFRRVGRYDESSHIWSQVKKVYMRLQHDKRAYCERRLASEEFGGAIEHDLEHYRPKGGIPEWPSKQIVRERRISYRFSTGEPFPEGYYLLAYHPFNYTAACKKCNSPLKSCYFPVARRRGAQSDDPVDLRGEEPFLIYPLGDLDEDPEEILTFIGINPVPRMKRGPRWRRARVTIDFFELDGREELWRERAEKIWNLYSTLELLQAGDAQRRTLAARAIEVLLSPASGHTSCGRVFRALYEEDRVRAGEIARTALEYLESQS